MPSMKRLLLLLALLAALAAVAAKPLSEAAARAALTPVGEIDIAALKAMGPGVLPHLVRIYKTTPDEDTRASYAWVFYSLGMKSPEARAALLQDVDTKNEKLRLQVQWALEEKSDRRREAIPRALCPTSERADLRNRRARCTRAIGR